MKPWIVRSRWVAVMVVIVSGATAQEKPEEGPLPVLLPKHVTPAMMTAAKNGLEYLKKTQANDGSYVNTADGTAYPMSMTALAGMAFLAGGHLPGRGEYGQAAERALDFVLDQVRSVDAGVADERARSVLGALGLSGDGPLRRIKHLR